jgi:sec-independent protein translocase protein TatB
MFDIAPSEMLLTAIVAIVVIGPKDMPLALRTAGRWMGKMRRMSNHLRTGFEAMIREAELEEMERKWREHNEAIMRAEPTPEGFSLTAPAAASPAAEAAASSPFPPAPSELRHEPAVAHEAQPATGQAATGQASIEHPAAQPPLP